MINIISFVILALYLLLHLYKILVLRKKSIKVYTLGNKEKFSYKIENLVTINSFLLSILWLFLVIKGNIASNIGIYLSLLGLIIIFTAMWTMNDSWRVGIDISSKPKLIQNGIYKYTRNPTYVGIHFLYLGVSLAYFNLYFFLLTICNIIFIDLLIKNEEKYLKSNLGNEYTVYISKVNRYL